MNSTPIIDVPPRIIRPTISRAVARPPLSPAAPFGGEDELRSLVRQIVQHDPALALLLARAGERNSQS
jgi:hypothetical protein